MTPRFVRRKIRAALTNHGPFLQPLSSTLPGIPEPSAWMSGIFRDPARLAALQATYAAQQAQLWAAMISGKAEQAPAVAPEPSDHRFAAREWRENPYYAYLKQSYLLATRHLTELTESLELDAGAKERLRFQVKQWCDAMCPANFAATNPAVLKRAQETRGESLTRGLANLIVDTHRGRISQTDEAAFELGVNVACTPGDVVYENELIQLIQYKATTPQVGATPLVMVPPCINKFYILDLQPANSFVRYAIEQGHTVFMVSWRNVGPEQGHLTWDDYLEKGIFSAFEAAKEITQSERVNALGFCIGGTLLGAALAVLSRKEQNYVSSATYLTTMLDFSEPGQIGVFIDGPSIAEREKEIGSGGIFGGAKLADVFSALRANDLIWPYVVNNYLMGGKPAPFDLLFWNADSTNLPGPMHCYYVRNTYFENKLAQPDALENCGVRVDLGRIQRPTFVYASREDHIVPWRAAYRTVPLLRGDSLFTLGAAGHIAGVINPPSAKRRSYWAADRYPEKPEEWLAAAEERQGSWWPRWSEWLERFKGENRPAPERTGNARHAAIEPAPGRYVKQKA